MYEFKGYDEDSFAIFADTKEPTEEQKEAETRFDEWLKAYGARREKKC